MDDDYWRKRRASKEEKYRPLREALRTATGAEIRQATLVIGIRGSLRAPDSEWEWKDQLACLNLPMASFHELRRLAVASAISAAATL